jgi:hypothetical protein
MVSSDSIGRGPDMAAFYLDPGNRQAHRIVNPRRRCRSLSGIIQSRHSRLTVPMKRSQYALA